MTTINIKHAHTFLATTAFAVSVFCAPLASAADPRDQFVVDEGRRLADVLLDVSANAYQCIFWEKSLKTYMSKAKIQQFGTGAEYAPYIGRLPYPFNTGFSIGVYYTTPQLAIRARTIATDAMLAKHVCTEAFDVGTPACEQRLPDGRIVPCT